MADAHHIPGLPPSAWYFPNFISEAEEEYLQRKIAESPLPRWKTVASGRRLQYLGGSLTKNNILIPEALPAWCTDFPDLISRITCTTDVFKAAPGDDSVKEADTGMPNQLLINEYAPGQGISPHEDGPAYHPAVATISLTSPQCIDIYQYLSPTDPSPPLTTSVSASISGNDDINDTTSVSSGRAIAAVPLARIYLEPRSLLILSSSLYASHLHGISEITEDILVGPTSDSEEHKPDDAKSSSVPVANLTLLDPAIQETIVRDGRFVSTRGTRVSLTFRKVERVMKGALGGGMGRKGLFGKR
ncbi:hypothetical protein NliqN6_0887 [Naganishia liquefaciens]|uniref:Fe2OG dioxygenase domain-containing protein n=1 Tax=Naganishia liquefaciens TaxID=104408 RepID=A0A8H3TNT9_9TREE|nr:hypothetical protein NliqN6_0887 [Naganishia liquefaciens]